MSCETGNISDVIKIKQEIENYPNIFDDEPSTYYNTEYNVELQSQPIEIPEEEIKEEEVTAIEKEPQFLTVKLKPEIKNVESQDRPHACTICGKSFKQLWHLKGHVLIHMREKKYVCEFCGERFSFQRELSGHVGIHTWKKKFTCSFCGKPFPSSSKLETHMRVHTGERPYQCDVCDKKFKVKCNLTEHQKIHVGERMHQCSFCERFVP